MNKRRILIDSTVYIPQELIKKHNITVVSLNVTDGTDTYPEVTVDNDFIWKMQDQGASWKTSQPAPGDFLEAYNKLFEEGAEDLLCSVIPEHQWNLSKCASSEKYAARPDKVHLFDTQLAAYGTEMIAVELIDMVSNGASNEEIEERITKIISTSHQMFTVENLFSLVKGGRISTAKAAIGTVPGIKPIVEVIKGKLELVKSERTYRKIHKYFIDSIKKSLEGNTNVTFYVTSQNSFENASSVKDMLLEEFPGSKLTFTEYLGPVFSIHVGKKGYGISWFVE